MRLADLAGIGGDSRVTGFAIDHRKVAPGTVFGAFRGSVFNGEDFIPQAVERRRGGGGGPAGRRGRGRRPCRRPRSRGASSRGWRRNSSGPFPETMVAVTGTNGKTSSVELTRQLWRMAGHHAASIGTLGVTTADDRTTTGLTTPDIVTFLSNMAGLAREGVTHAAFEASSHGLAAISHRGAAGARRRLHQFQPRPSRLSRDDGGLFRGQDAAVRRSGRAGRRGGDLDGRCQVGRGARARRGAGAPAADRRRARRDAAAGRADADPARPAPRSSRRRARRTRSSCR